MRERDNKGRFTAIHNGKKTKLYRVWCSMRERCSNPNNKSYSRYGGRGITVCEEWNSFSTFKEWALKNGYFEKLTIDRINNEEGYKPSNCRWVDHKTQNRNYSRNHLITYMGKTQCLTDWAEEFGIKRATVLYRLKQGKPLELVFDKRDRRTLI